MACKQGADFRFLYPLNLTIKEKIEIVARQVYRADGVEYLPAAVRPASHPHIATVVRLARRMRLQAERSVKKLLSCRQHFPSHLSIS
jgi:hypothetical protein